MVRLSSFRALSLLLIAFLASLGACAPPPLEVAKKGLPSAPPLATLLFPKGEAALARAKAATLLPADTRMVALVASPLAILRAGGLPAIAPEMAPYRDGLSGAAAWVTGLEADGAAAWADKGLALDRPWGVASLGSTGVRVGIVEVSDVAVFAATAMKDGKAREGATMPTWEIEEGPVVVLRDGVAFFVHGEAKTASEAVKALAAVKPSTSLAEHGPFARAMGEVAHGAHAAVYASGLGLLGDAKEMAPLRKRVEGVAWGADLSAKRTLIKGFVASTGPLLRKRERAPVLELAEREHLVRALDVSVDPALLPALWAHHAKHHRLQRRFAQLELDPTTSLLPLLNGDVSLREVRDEASRQLRETWLFGVKDEAALRAFLDESKLAEKDSEHPLLGLDVQIDDGQLRVTNRWPRDGAPVARPRNVRPLHQDSAVPALAQIEGVSSMVALDGGVLFSLLGRFGLALLPGGFSSAPRVDRPRIRSLRVPSRRPRSKPSKAKTRALQKSLKRLRKKKRRLEKQGRKLREGLAGIGRRGLERWLTGTGLVAMWLRPEDAGVTFYATRVEGEEDTSAWLEHTGWLIADNSNRARMVAQLAKNDEAVRKVNRQLIRVESALGMGRIADVLADGALLRALDNTGPVNILSAADIEGTPGGVLGAFGSVGSGVQRAGGGVGGLGASAN